MQKQTSTGMEIKVLKSVTDYLYQAVKKYPDKSAIIDGENKITYNEMKKYAESISCFLLKHLKENHRPIIVFMDKNIYSLPCFMGIALSGNIYVPLDTKAPNDRISAIFNILNYSYIITDNKNMLKTKELDVNNENIVNICDILHYDVDFSTISKAEINIIDTDPLYIIFTSGSTGIPKGVTISHRAVLDFTEECSEAMEFSEQEVFLSQAPFYFDASVPDIYCTLRNAATLHLVPQQMFSFPIKILQYIKDNSINAIFWVPSALILVANFKALGKIDLPKLRKIMFCGEVMPAKQLNMWKKALPHAKYVNFYGPSETTYASTYYIIDRDFEDNDKLPIGRAANNTRVLVLNNNKCVEKNETGELYIQGSGLALGYYNDIDKTKEVFVQNPLHNNYIDIVYKTGDLVKINDLDEIIYIGRKDFQIKHMGYRIELGEIEAAANGYSNIESCCCIYDKSSKTIIMFVQTKDNIDNIKKYIKEKIPEYMLPGKYIKMNSLPLNSNGKIDRKYLSTQTDNI